MKFTGLQVLEITMEPNDSGADTIKGYLKELLTTIWVEEDGFSGKRPFGNSSWQYEIYKALIVAGAVKGELDDDGYVEYIDTEKANKLVQSAIAAL